MANPGRFTPGATMLRFTLISLATLASLGACSPKATDSAPRTVHKRTPIGPMLQEELNLTASSFDNTPLDVVVVLRGRNIVMGVPEETGTVTLEDGRDPVYELNGNVVSEDVLNTSTKAHLATVSKRSEAIREARRQDAQTLVQRHDWLDLPSARRSIAEGRSTLKARLTSTQVQQLLHESADLVEAVELDLPPSASMSGAHSAMRVDTYAHRYGHEGAGVGVYMSEAGGNCPGANHINSTLFTNLESSGDALHANMVGNILAETAPSAHIFCGAAASTDPDPASRTPQVLISTHSFGWPYNDTGYRSEDREFDNAVYDDRLAVFVAAGNTLSSLSTDTVLTPAKAFNVTTVGNYDDLTGSMNSSSLFENPDAGNEKPEVVAPGTDIVTSAGTGSGTSYSAPFAAGFAADLMGRYTWLQGHPERVKALMMAGATDNIEGASDLSDLDGAGGIDYLNSGFNGSNTYWSGGNSSWFGSSGRVQTTRTFTSGRRYRIALVWLVPGSYAFSNEQPNMDLDLYIRDPNGLYMKRSVSRDNSFEIIDFTPTVSGTYTIEIRRISNSGTGDVVMAVHSQRVL